VGRARDELGEAGGTEDAEAGVPGDGVPGEESSGRESAEGEQFDGQEDESAGED